MATVYAPPKSDAYTVLLSISLGALVVGSILLFLDWTQFGGLPRKDQSNPPAPTVQIGEPTGGTPATPPGTPPATATGTPPADGK